MSETSKIPVGIQALSWALKHPVMASVLGLAIVSGATFSGYKAVSYATAKDVNANGVRETASFVVHSGLESNNGTVLNSHKFTDKANKKVFVKDKSLLPGGLAGVVGKKIHVFTPLTEYTSPGGYKTMEHVVQTKDDMIIE